MEMEMDHDTSSSSLSNPGACEVRGRGGRGGEDDDSCPPPPPPPTRGTTENHHRVRTLRFVDDPTRLRRDRGERGRGWGRLIVQREETENVHWEWNAYGIERIGNGTHWGMERIREWGRAFG